MPEPVAAVAGSTVAIDPSLLVGAGSSSPTNALDKEAFLKLLVAQLKYQDPLNPSSNEEFIATTAQFTTIEKLDELAKQGTTAAQVSGLATASALVGRQVTVVDEEGQTKSATVLRGQFSAGSLTLVTDLGPVPLTQIVGVGPNPAPAGAPTSPAAPPGAPADPSTPDPSTTEPATTDPATTDPTPNPSNRENTPS